MHNLFTMRKHLGCRDEGVCIASRVVPPRPTILLEGGEFLAVETLVADPRESLADINEAAGVHDEDGLVCCMTDSQLDLLPDQTP